MRLIIWYAFVWKYECFSSKISKLDLLKNESREAEVIFFKAVYTDSNEMDSSNASE